MTAWLQGSDGGGVMDRVVSQLLTELDGIDAGAEVRVNGPALRLAWLGFGWAGILDCKLPMAMQCSMACCVCVCACVLFGGYFSKRRCCVSW